MLYSNSADQQARPRPLLRGAENAVRRAFHTSGDELLHIDMVRFIAAFGIMASHSLEFMFPRDLREASHALTAGFTLFVDVFFVISGFVITYVYVNRMATARDFGKYMQRRAARLMPLHLATLALMTGLYVALGAAGVSSNTRPDLSAQCLASAAALVHAWFDCGGIPPNGASWSISAEMAMYLVFPLVLAILKLPRPVRILCFVALFGACAAVSGGAAQMSLAWSPLRAAPAFCLGALVYCERDWLKRGIPSWAPVLMCGLMVAGSFALVPRIVLLPLAYVTAISAIAADQSGAPRPWVRRVAPLGQLTYSVYLLHGFIIATTLNALGDKILNLDFGWMIPFTLLTWLVVMIAGAVSYVFFERPARSFIDRL